MDTAQLRYGRLALLIIAVAFLSGAAVQALRTLPDPDLFSASTGSIIPIAVTAAVVAVVLLRRPSWLTRTGPSGPASD